MELNWETIDTIEDGFEGRIGYVDNSTVLQRAFVPQHYAGGRSFPSHYIYRSLVYRDGVVINTSISTLVASN